MDLAVVRPASAPLGGGWIAAALRDGSGAPLPIRRHRDVELADWLEAERTVLAWARVDGRVAVLAGRRDGGAVEPTGVADAVCALTDRVTWATARGGTLRWLGRPAGIYAVGRGGTESTNDVLHVRAGARAAVLKVYRLAGAGDDECAALEALASTGLVPGILARLMYRRPGRRETVIALLLEAVPGVTMDVPLRRGLEASWQRGDAVLTAADRAVLRRVCAATRQLHASLADAAGGAARCGVREERPSRLADMLADLDAVRVLADSACGRVMLRHAGDAALRLARVVVADPPGHGDLHLSNVLVDDRDVRFIDVSGANGGPADDFAALRRGVECMCLDLQVDRVGRQTSSPDDVAAALRRAAFSASPDREALLAPLALPDPGRHQPSWDGWCREAAAELAGVGTSAAERFAYLARLVHDLRYHLEHGRTYYADLAWWHLARWCLAARVGAAVS